MKTVAVVGGGASGMMAALTAAGQAENRILLFERQQRVGRKLAVTGNGRCNLTNTLSREDRYHGENREFPAFALDAFPPEEELRFFSSLGLLTTEEYGGRVYPRSDSANSVVDVLRFACESRGVELLTSCEVERITRSGAGFSLYAAEKEYFADRVIIACGGAAGSRQGGGMSGYELLKSLGHGRTALRPALAQITVDSDYPKALKGIRADAALTLLCGGRTVAESRGELQFTEKGLSGPAGFDLARSVGQLGDAKKEISADFFAGLEEQTLTDMLVKRSGEWRGHDCSELFAGMLHNRLGAMIVKYAGLDRTKPITELSRKEAERAVRAAKAFRFPVRGTEGFESAQVTAGGMRTEEFNPRTMESRLVPGLYACGEVLDVDGDCGGFNLRWAWASGRLAGRLGE